MPTPVGAARQCLTEEAARALDDAVAVARRRSHAQTTSLHAVSALLSLPSSALRDACSRARSGAYPYTPRLQFRALELSVGVSLDRLPSSTKAQEEPPVSNSLMAAIKRSQANQRRHPESFHLHQIHSQQQTASLLKVELKHFMLSILDDPIVSRVFGEAGFRSCDIKLAIVHPPVTPQSNRLPRTLCPPIFLCNLTDSDPAARRRFPFPFSGFEEKDENCKRIGDVLVRKSGKNPLLIGVSAAEALKRFIEAVQKGRASSLLPPEVSSFSAVCIEEEISEFVVEGGSEEKMGLKLKEVGHLAQQCSGDGGAGVIVNFGEMKALVDDGVLSDALSFVVVQLKGLLEIHCGKLWLIGAAGSYDMYMKLLARFPAIEKDWDLHLLPISSSKASVDGVYSKSSLMGSFVPFGGFFSGPSDFTNPLSSTNQSFIRCHQCTEKYEQEVASIRKDGSAITVGDQCSTSSPSWLQTIELDPGKGVDLAKTKADNTTLSETVLGLQKKWNDICRKIHHGQPFPKMDNCQAGSHVASPEGSHTAADRRESSGEDSSIQESRSAKHHCLPMDMQKSFLSKQNLVMQVASDAEYAGMQSKQLIRDSKGQQLELGSPCRSPFSIPTMNLPTDHTSSSSVTSVTTDLGLGTLYASTRKGPRSPKLQDHRERLRHLSGSISAEFDALSENSPHQIAQSSSCSGSNFGGQFDPRDFKSLRRVLTEKVCWQDEAICTISEAISRCRSGGGRHHGSKGRGDIWLTLIGPDRVGKKKIAIALAELMFGTRESLISVDMGERGCQSDSIFQWESQDDYDVKFRGKTAVDYVAGELSRRPHSVVFLENVDKADFLAQSNLSQAIRTGKFPDSHGREISINNMIFVTTSATKKGSKNHYLENEPVKFSEEMVLGAKRCQMQILNIGDASQTKGMNVRIAPREGSLNSSSVNKRKLIDSSASIEETSELQKRGNKASRSFLDLNLPVDEIDEGMNCGDYDSDSISENSEAWMEDFLDQVDEAVVLKPFKFDALAEKLVKEINQEFKKVLGSEYQLEIDFGVMVQLLAACWLSDEKKAVEEWIEQVLSRSFAETRQRYRLTAHSVIKLVAGGALSVQEQTPGVCLPARISLN
ncbi:protein SMAX1-LIKE 7-like [Rosa rugosa]|uniref:protein SMAX1-LIKE 7-like n=1 Tax=Rosa rugosa TaxID=74645 RepID=UPI002B40CF1A|nr:protein SMAX1-LIKE 7-like [Rosa rugosa]